MLYSKEELEKMGEVHQEIAEYMKANPRPSIDLEDMTKMKEGMIIMEKAANANMPPVPAEEEFYHEIPMRDGFMSSLKIQKPPAGSTPGPLIVLCFGGGFVGGTNDQFIKIGRALKDLFGATVVSISYRLAPEYKFPFSQHDTWDSMKWIGDNATGALLSSDPTKGFLMGGVSAGGCLTAAFSRIFQEEPIAFPLTGQWLSVPAIMDVSNVPDKYKEYHISSEQFASGEFFSRETRRKLQALVDADITSPLRYAVNSKTDISRQPKTYFQVDGLDPLRDDGLIYEEMLKEAGVETKIDVYPGCPHGHEEAYPTLEVSKKTNVDTMIGFGWLLDKEVTREQAAKALGM